MEENRKLIFITGASGFLGKHFIIDSETNNFKIYALTRNKKKLETDPVYGNINILEGEIMEIDKFTKELSGCNYLIHIAGEKKDEAKMKETNVEAMKKIILILRGLPSLKLIYISSCGVYNIQKHPENIITENDSCYPESLYEKTKFEAENILRKNLAGNPVQYIILRPSNVFGEFDRSYKLLNLMKAVKKGMFFRIDDNAFVNFVYVKYVTSAMIYFLQKDKFTNEIFNINTPVLLNEVITILKRELKSGNKSLKIPRSLLYPLSLIVDMLPKRYQLFNSEKYLALTNRKIYSVEKLRAEFIVNDREIFEVGLHNLVSWYKNNGLL